MRCQACRGETLDTRWSPLCPVCYEELRLEQRRDQTRPPHLDATAWTDVDQLEAGFESALGPQLP